MNAFLNLLKPPGMTSHDAVNFVRRVSGIRHIGHAGTLDPGAAGVIVLGIGFASRLIELLSSLNKTYRAEFTFGVETDTLDAQGNITRRMDAGAIERVELLETMRSFIGESDQRIPSFSAARVNGQRLYQLSRAGIDVESPIRHIRIDEIELLRFTPGAQPVALVQITCSTGTYIRAIARDLGARLNNCAHMTFLVRTRIGSFTISNSVTIEHLLDAFRHGHFESILTSPSEALIHIPTVSVTGQDLKSIRNGRRIALSSDSEQVLGASDTAHVLIKDQDEQVIAVARRRHDDGRIVLIPEKVSPLDREVEDPERS